MPKPLDENLSVVRQRWYSPETAAREIAAFECRFGKEALELAFHIAFPSIVSPELVNLIHFNFLYQKAIPWTAEADILLSPLCRPFNDRMYEVEPGVRELLLLELEHRFGPGRLKQLAEFLMHYFRENALNNYPETAKWTHYLIAEAYLEPDAAIGKMKEILASQTPEDAGSASPLSRKIHIAAISEIVAEPLSWSDQYDNFQDLMSLSRKIAGEYYGASEEVQVFLSPKPIVARNPFKYSGPLDLVRDQMCLIPRRDELNRMINGILRGDYWTIIGPHGIGKTTFLRQLCGEIEKTHYVVYFDFQIAPRNEANFYNWLIDTIYEHIPSMAIKNSKADRYKYDPRISFQYFLETFKPIESHKKVILIFDEFDDPSFVEFLHLWRKVYHDRYRKPLKEYSIVTSGSIDPSKLWTGTSSPYNIAEKLLLKDFSYEESKSFIENSFSRLNLQIRQEAIEKMLNQVSGHPQMLQYACFNLAEIAIKEKRIIQESDIDKVIQRLMVENHSIGSLEYMLKNDSKLRGLIAAIIKGEKKKFHIYKNYSFEGVGPIVEDEDWNCKIRNEVFKTFAKEFLNVKEKEERYELLEVIGQGGFSTVYKAKDTLMQRTVAVKIFKNERMQELENPNLFTKEAMASARLIHQNIVILYDAGKINNDLFFAMEYVRGKSLGKVLLEEGPLTVKDTLWVAKCLFTALEYCHVRNVLHLNLKPRKLLYSTGEIKITGFGFLHSLKRQLNEGTRLGTPAFMSPEMIVGETIDKRADFYSAGITLYQLVTGELPYKSKYDILPQHLEERIPSARYIRPDIPVKLDEIIKKCMAKEKEDRFQSAKEVLDILNELGEIKGFSRMDLDDTRRLKRSDISSIGNEETERTKQPDIDSFEFEDTVRIKQPDIASTKFEKIDNPYAEYAEGGIVGDSSMFYGRSEIITSITDAFHNSLEPGQSFLISGQRRIGKSSLLFQLGRLLKNDESFLVVEIGSTALILDPESDAPLEHQLCWAISKTIEDAALDHTEESQTRLELQFPEYNDFLKHPFPHEALLEFVDKTMAQLPPIRKGKKIQPVILIDEWSYIFSQFEASKISGSFMQSVYTLFQSKRFHFVLVGHGFIEDYNTRLVDVLKSTHSVQLSYLTHEEAAMLIDDPIRTGGPNGQSRYRGDAIRRIVELTAGHPYLIQIFCAQLVDYMNRNEISVVTELDVEKVKDRLIKGRRALSIDRFDGFINNSYSSDDTLKVLKTIADNSTTGSCPAEDITCKTEVPVNTILDELAKREVIQIEHELSVRIRVGLFAEWLRNN